MKVSAFAWDPSKKLGGATLIPLKELGLPWGLGIERQKYQEAFACQQTAFGVVEWWERV